MFSCGSWCYWTSTLMISQGRMCVECVRNGLHSDIQVPFFRQCLNLWHFISVFRAWRFIVIHVSTLLFIVVGIYTTQHGRVVDETDRVTATDRMPISETWLCVCIFSSHVSHVQIRMTSAATFCQLSFWLKKCIPSLGTQHGIVGHWSCRALYSRCFFAFVFLSYVILGIWWPSHQTL